MSGEVYHRHVPRSSAQHLTQQELANMEYDKLFADLSLDEIPHYHPIPPEMAHHGDCDEHDRNSFLPAKSKYRECPDSNDGLTRDALMSCRSPPSTHHAHLRGNSSIKIIRESVMCVHFVIVLTLCFVFSTCAMTFAEASPPFPIERPEEKSQGLGEVDMCKILQIPCVHGTCVNDSTPQCECDQGWIGSTCDMCGGRMKLTDTSGYIIDGYTNYTTNNKCTWLIEAPNPSDEIRLRFLHFATECNWDHLYMYNGSSIFDPQVAAYSGLVIPQGVTSDVMPEVVMKGYAYLHFYSDAAYNMSGFNISYIVGMSCPLDCSSHGSCDPASGVCTCYEDWSGSGCNIPACPNNCSQPSGICNTDTKLCECTTGKGYDCSIPENEGYWERVEIKSDPPTPRTSHKTVIHGNQLYAFYGYEFNVNNQDHVVRLDLNSLVWEKIAPTTNVVPTPRYGHTTVLYQDTVLMYGGQLIEAGRVSDDLWQFDLDKDEWTMLRPEGETPQAVVGHMAHVLGDVMYVVCGHNPVFGYTNIVQEFHMVEDKWIIPTTTGAAVLGGYGQSSVYDSSAGVFYIHGGYVSNATSVYLLTDELYSYDPLARNWDLLRASGLPKFLHTAVWLDGLMYVFGGNTHNDTSTSKGAKCFSTNFLAYDPACNQWRELDPPLLHEDISRFGHSADVFTSDRKMYLLGGFNGQVLGDVLTYTPKKCEAFINKGECEGKSPACVWTDSDVCGTNDQRYGVPSNDLKHPQCPLSTAQESQSACKRFGTCKSCMDTKHHDCVWCGKGCVYREDASSNCSRILTSSQCPANSSVAQCGGIYNCHACHTTKGCHWTPKLCTIGFEQVGEEATCNKACSLYTNCENCTQSKCMWCGSESRCVESLDYVSSFPYGQCREWTSERQTCSVTQCSGLRTCEECQKSPACGWCDDGSDTGLGQCMEGALHGPISNTNIDLAKCPANQWFFDHCPVCQCNGHSQCENDTDVCEQCEDNTVGTHCEHCEDGYYGTATNGGNCTACTCNGQADSCDRVTGKCFCHTRGITGHNCDVCDEEDKYFGDPKNGGTCYYEVAINYKFTFNLSKDKADSKHWTHVNFMNEPPDPERDVDFKINCSSEEALLNITISVKGEPEEVLVSGVSCQMYEDKFPHSQYDFGKGTNTTFFVYVYNFRTPFVVEISFLQTDPIDLIHFFITFFSCFLSLLLIAAVVWKVKQKCDMYRRRQRMVVEMEQMASRPFGMCTLDVPKAQLEPFLRQEAMNSVNTQVISSSNARASQRLKKAAQARYSPSPIALEPLSSNKAAILTLFVRLPTGDEEYTPPDQQGLTVGSALVTIGSHRKNSTDPQQRGDKNSKPRKQMDSGEGNCV